MMVMDLVNYPSFKQRRASVYIYNTREEIDRFAGSFEGD
jgi:selenocysteine lyase/cysteine desulfurase